MSTRPPCRRRKRNDFCVLVSGIVAERGSQRAGSNVTDIRPSCELRYHRSMRRFTLDAISARNDNAETSSADRQYVDCHLFSLYMAIGGCVSDFSLPLHLAGAARRSRLIESRPEDWSACQILQKCAVRDAHHGSYVMGQCSLRPREIEGRLPTWIRRSIPGSSGFPRQPSLPVFC